MKDYYFEVVNKEKFRGMISNVCYKYGLTYMDTIYELVGGELEVEVNEESKVVEITIYDGDSYFSIYRREIDVRYIKEMCEKIKGIADKFNQSFLTEDEAVETVFKDI